ncbi:polysaccharide deacetylase family protein [Methylobacterium sp. WL64]|uniref:polysaccharide deacetylase family protein n=1 Tax=Methylobacterium sp. WL64 TaxID=2603894 RepID=UPI00164FAFD2|nr:polysaccharide deacetylase family protein [Methylobacterium sp. WL64]
MAVTDVFLDALLDHAKHRRIDVISLDECVARLKVNDYSPFLCLTFDDGYRDNYDIAYPVLRKHDVPAAIFLATALLDRTGPMWWHPLERAISISTEFGLGTDRQALKTPLDRRIAYDKWASYFRASDLSENVKLVHELAASNQHFLISDAFENALEWGMVKEMTDSGLITFGAHTVTHPVMANLSENKAIAEVVISRDRVAEMTGSRTKYFAYPFGQPHETGAQAHRIVAEADFAAAFTTTPATLKASNSKYRFHLPRIMLTQETQNIGCVNAYISGLTELIKRG